MTEVHERLAGQRGPKHVGRGGMLLLALVLASSSASCGRKGPLKPLKQQTVGHVSERLPSSPVLVLPDAFPVFPDF